jgi:hypothetical protein
VTPPAVTETAAVAAAARRVVDQLGVPLHVRATTAALEADGIRDADASGIARDCRDVFDLGRVVHEHCLATSRDTTRSDAATQTRDADWRRIVRHYWRALAYTLPMIAQGVALVILHVSVWGSAQLSRGEQTGIGLALVTSLIMIGPFTQAMTRRLYYYGYQADMRAVRRTTIRWVAAGATVGLIVAPLCALVIAAVAAWSPTATAFCVFLALQPSMWIANAVLFAIGRSTVAAAAVLLPTIPVWAALRAGLDPLAVHAAGLAAADLLLVAAAVVLVDRLARNYQPARRPLPPPLLVRSVGGYAVWGLVYFLLIFTDRLVAWTGDGHLSFVPAYEAALQIALVPLIVTLPLLEHALIRLGELLDDASHQPDPLATTAARRVAIRYHALLVAISVAAYSMIAAGFWTLVTVRPGLLPLHAGQLVASGAAHTALGLALVAYGLFIAALGVCSAYQLLARPWPLVIAGSLGVVVDLLVGVTARRTGPPEAASVGLLAGAAVFAFVITMLWRRQQTRIGYLWFASR